MSDNLIKINANSNICDSRVVINKNFAVLSKKLTNIDAIVSNNVDKKISALLNDKEFFDKLSKTDFFAKVARSGSYNDLKFTPTILKLDREESTKLLSEEKIKELINNSIETAVANFINTYFGFKIEGDIQNIAQYVNSIYSNTSRNYRYKSIYDGTLTSIDEDNISDKANLKSVVINSIVTRIEGVFQNCPKLESIEFGVNIQNIEENAFDGCSSLTKFHFNGTINQWNAKQYNNLPDSLIFVDCSDGTIILKQYLSTYFDGSKKYESKISDTANLQEVSIVHGVTSIGDGLRGCFNLNFVEIPSTVTNIERTAFEGCDSLSELTFKGTRELWISRFGNTKIFDTINVVHCTDIDIVFTKYISTYYLTDQMPIAAFSMDSDDDIIFSGYVGEDTIVVYEDEISNKQRLKSVIVNTNVEQIFMSTFSDCTFLESVELPDSCSTIGENAFENCSSLTSINIPNKVDTIHKSTFENCVSLESVVLPSSITTINDRAFAGCNALTNIEYNGTKDQFAGIETDGEWKPDSLNVVNCASGKYTIITKYKLTYNDNTIAYLNNIDESLRTSVKTVEITDYYETNILDNEFQNCTSLESITIPNRVTSIGENAFNGCSKLTSVTIPNTITNIGDSTFRGCSKLTSVTIPNSVKTMGSHVFDGCISLPYDGNVQYNSVQYNINNYNYVVGVKDNTQKSYTIHTYVKWIGENAFSGCTNLESITIPNRVTSIGENAFNGCTNLKTVYNNSKLNIFAGNDDNGGVAKNANAVFGDFLIYTCANKISIQDIAQCFKYDSFGEKEYYFNEGKGIVRFGGLKGIVGTNFNKLATKYNIQSITIPKSQNLTSITDYRLFYNWKNLQSVVIPKNISSIIPGIFNQCGLKSVVYENGTTQISPAAFVNCTNLTSIDIPNTVTSIGYQSFKNSGLTSITIPNSVTIIGYQAFENCSNLSYVHIPTSVNNIGKDVFNGCSSLSEIRYAGTTQQWRNITKDSNWLGDIQIIIHCSNGDIIAPAPSYYNNNVIEPQLAKIIASTDENNTVEIPNDVPWSGLIKK